MIAVDVAERLGARSSGEGSWSAVCPAHEDRNPSLSIATGENGGVVVHCHAGCSTADVVAAAGLAMLDLAPPKHANDDHPIATYRYTDEVGALLFEVVRRPGKRFHQRPANGRTGPGAMSGVPMVLYRLPAVVKAVQAGVTVLVVEGEKDADNLTAAGWCATTAPMGAGKWSRVRDHARQVLAGAEVIVVADRDEPGYRHAADVVASLRDVASSVLLVEAAEGKDVSDHLAAGLTVEQLVEAAGEPPPDTESPEPAYEPVPIVDWAELFDRSVVDDAYVDGLLHPGRWTQFVAAAKVGKSTLAMHLTTSLARGRDPFTNVERTPLRVLYLDAEMGRLDVYERLSAAQFGPAELALVAYSDMPPRCDEIQGGTAVVSAAKLNQADVVILDGMNGMVSGAENDDLTWRNMFDYTIAPLKRAGIAVLSTDNMGKDRTRGSRGSSVKTDKADAVFELARIDGGIRLKRTHTRTASMVAELDLHMFGIEGDEPIGYRVAPNSWPLGTLDAVKVLDDVGVPADFGRDKARRELNLVGVKMRDTVLSAAIRYRKAHPARAAQPPGTGAGTGDPEQLTGTGQWK